MTALLAIHATQDKIRALQDAQRQFGIATSGLRPWIDHGGRTYFNQLTAEMGAMNNVPVHNLSQFYKVGMDCEKIAATAQNSWRSGVLPRRSPVVGRAQEPPGGRDGLP